MNQLHSASETPHGLLKELARICVLIVLIAVIPALVVLPFAMGSPPASAYTHVAASSDDPALFECDALAGGAERSELCRSLSFEWRSGWRDWRADWSLPETWIQQAIRESNAAAATASRSSAKTDDFEYWSRIYADAARKNRDRVEVFARGFLVLARRNRLSRRRTLELVTGFVQNLEYAVPENYLQLYTPPRLLELGRGDCDSRALFLALVFDRLGYDAVLLLSPRYQHAMVGVLCETCDGAVLRGPHGVAYSFIETTARTPPGFLHPAVNNPAHWRALKLP